MIMRSGSSECEVETDCRRGKFVISSYLLLSCQSAIVLRCDVAKVLLPCFLSPALGVQRCLESVRPDQMPIDLTPCLARGLVTDELEAVSLNAKQVSLHFPKDILRIPRSGVVLVRVDMFSRNISRYH